MGDKTLSHYLYNDDIYHNMNVFVSNTNVDRATALHKMIRLFVMGLGGEAYLNFMGNEFGHPEWIDFPREGNGFSYHYARRQWDLRDNTELKYHNLFNWDKAMNALEKKFKWLSSGHQYVTLTHEGDKLVVFERGDLIFVFNFHICNSYEHYKIGTMWASDHIIVLNSDCGQFGGLDRLKPAQEIFFPHKREGWNNRPNSIQIYIPARSCIVFCAEENMAKYGLKLNGRPKTE